jgi:hypothetical protein
MISTNTGKRPLIFRVYPEHKSLYFEVRVYPTKGAMLRDVRGRHRSALANDTIGYCACYPKSSRHTNKRRIGRIFLYRGALDHDTLAHEALHASLGYMCRRGIKSLEVTDSEAAPNEELLCRCLGGMVGDICRRLKKE